MRKATKGKTFGKRPFVFAQVCTDKGTADTLRRNVNERSSDEEARVFPRSVKAGGTSVTVYALVIRKREEKP